MKEKGLAAYRRERRDGWRLYVDAARLPDGWWPEVRRHLAGDRSILRRSRHASTSIVTVRGRHGTLRGYLKIYRRSGWRTDLKDTLRDSKAVWALRMSVALAEDGFGVPRVLAAGERRRGLLLQEAFLLTLAVDAPTLYSLPEVWDRLSPSERRHGKRALLRALGAEVGRLHRMRYVPGDLIPTNVLGGLDQPGQFHFLDHDRTRRAGCFDGERTYRRNLVELNRIEVSGVTHTDRYRVLESYARVRGWDSRRLRREARRLAAGTLRRRARLTRLRERGRTSRTRR